jgi:CheY-like chemotaxis protein
VSSPRILVVNDEAGINTVLTVTLRRAGYEVTSAADGLEAVEAVQREAPDSILLDIMMPRSDGLEALRRIRAHAPTAQVPVIMRWASRSASRSGTSRARASRPLLMVMVRTLLREIARSLSGPAEVLTRLNASLCLDLLVLAVLDPAQPGRVSLSSAGHPDPVLFRAGGEPAAVTMGGAGGPVLGVFDDAVFDQTTFTLDAPGDALILLTDGILEALDQDGRRPGRAAIRPVLVRERARSPQALARLLTEDVLRRGGSRIQDDMTVFVLRR